MPLNLNKQIHKKLSSMDSFAIVDLETTGGNPKENRIIEIAIVISNGQQIIDQFQTLINPERPINPYVSKLTTITDEMVASAPLFKEVSEKILTKISNHIFVAHNISFDYTILNRALKRIGKELNQKKICTVQLSQRVYSQLKPHRLSSICQSLDIKLETAHRALDDAKATTHLLHRILKEDTGIKCAHLMLKNGILDKEIPPHIDRQIIDTLPEKFGYFTFKDTKGVPLYISSSKNIRRDVVQFFLKAKQSSRIKMLCKDTSKIEAIQTGSILIAQLNVIRKKEERKYPYNKYTHTQKFTYGVFLHLKPFSPLTPIIKKLAEKQPNDILVVKGVNKKNTTQILNYIKKKHGLSIYFEKQNKYLPQETSLNQINEKIVKAFKGFLFPYKNCFIIVEAYKDSYVDIICITNYAYVGISTVSKTDEKNLDIILKNMKTDFDTLEKHKIIKSYMKKSKKYTIMPFNNSLETP